MTDSNREEYVIILGAMKSGTTTLFKLLAEHPQIAFAKPKEPGFFAFEDVHAKGYDWYHSLFNFDPAQHRYRLEASTDYTKQPYVTGVWDRMKARPNARFKLLYIVRDPIKRLESHARHTQRARLEIGREVAPRDDHSLDSGVSAPSLAMTRYASQLDAYADPYAAGDLKVVTLEDLTADPRGVMAGVFGFLGLEPTQVPETTPQYNVANSHTKVDDSWLKLTSIPVVSSLAKALMPQDLRDRLKARFTRKVTVEGRFKMTPQERATYGALLAPEAARLERDYGVTQAGQWDLPKGQSD